MKRSPPFTPPGLTRIPVAVAVASAVERRLDALNAAQQDYNTAVELALASAKADVGLRVVAVDSSATTPALFVPVPPTETP